jgi:hypothetical protein
MKTLNPANPANNGARPDTWTPTAEETGAYSQAEVNALLTPVKFSVTPSSGTSLYADYCYRVGNVAYFNVQLNISSFSSSAWHTVATYSFSDGKTGYVRLRVPDNSGSASIRDFEIQRGALAVWLPSGSGMSAFICAAVPLV